MRARVTCGARVGRQPRRGSEHDRRQQHDRRVEAKYRRRCRRRDEHQSEQTPRALPCAAGHPRSKRIEHARAPAPVGEHQQRREEPDGRSQLAQRRSGPTEADRADREHQRRGEHRDHPVGRPEPGRNVAAPSWPRSSSGCWMTRRCGGLRSVAWPHTTTRATAESILRRYPSLTPAERDDAIATLASRPAWALALLDAVGKGTVPRRDLNSDRRPADPGVPGPEADTRALERAWGTLRPTARDKAPLIAKYKTILASPDLPAPDPDRGRALFGRICAQCHRLFDQGGDVGPDLTGSDRANPDYILENVLDPSATVGRDYTLTTVATTRRPARLRHPPRADAKRPGDPDALRADHRAPRRRRGDQGLNDIHDAGGPARTADAAGDPRPVRLPGDDAAGAEAENR